MTEADVKEIKSMLEMIMDHLGLTKSPRPTRKQIEDLATADVLKFRQKRIKKGHVGEGPGK